MHIQIPENEPIYLELGLPEGLGLDAGHARVRHFLLLRALKHGAARPVRTRHHLDAPARDTQLADPCGTDRWVASTVAAPIPVSLVTVVAQRPVPPSDLGFRPSS